jgi:hypothetical protein
LGAGLAGVCLPAIFTEGLADRALAFGAGVRLPAGFFPRATGFFAGPFLAAVAPARRSFRAAGFLAGLARALGLLRDFAARTALALGLTRDFLTGFECFGHDRPTSCGADLYRPPAGCREFENGGGWGSFKL